MQNAKSEPELKTYMAVPSKRKTTYSSAGILELRVMLLTDSSSPPSAVGMVR